MEQAPQRETMTQSEIDALLRDVTTGNLTATPSLGSLEMARRITSNYKQLMGAIRRCEIEPLANVGPEERAERYAQVHHYAHRNWLLKKGFTDKAHFRAFMNGKAEKKGMILDWEGGNGSTAQ